MLRLFGWLKRKLERRHQGPSLYRGLGGSHQPIGNQKQNAISNAINRLVQSNEVTNHNQSAYDKRKFKWDRWTTVGVWTYTILTVPLIIFSGYSARYSYQAAVQARRQADIADQARLATARPWLDVEFSAGSLQWENGEPVSFDFNFAQKNLGFSPAIAYSLYGEVSVIDLKKEGNPNPKIRSTCNRAEELVVQALQQIIFMGKFSIEQSRGMFLTHSAIENYKKNWSNATKYPIESINSIWATYFVCAVYKIPGDNTWRHTGKYFTIGIKGATNPGVPINPGFAESPITMREDGNYAD